MRPIPIFSATIVSIIAMLIGFHPRLPAQGPPPLPTADWYVGKNGNREGPFKTPVLGEKIRSGEVTKNHLVWEKGMADWKKAGEVAGLGRYFAPVPPPLPPDPPVPGGGSDFPIMLWGKTVTVAPYSTSATLKAAFSGISRTSRPSVDNRDRLQYDIQVLASEAPVTFLFDFSRGGKLERVLIDAFDVRQNPPAVDLVRWLNARGRGSTILIDGYQTTTWRQNGWKFVHRVGGDGEDSVYSVEAEPIESGVVKPVAVAKFDGMWDGVLNPIGDDPIAFELFLAVDSWPGKRTPASGTFVAVVPGEGAKRLAIGGVLIDGNRIRFSVADPGSGDVVRFDVRQERDTMKGIADNSGSERATVTMSRRR